MRVLLSGASGLIGTALGEALEARGDTVIRLVRPASPPSNGTSVAWDPASEFLDEAALANEGPLDAVVNLAGAGIADKRWTSARKEEILSSRVASTQLLASAMASLSSRPEVFISGSAIGIYGDRGDEILDERSRPGSGFLAEVCEQWEAAATPARDAEIRLVLPRTGIVLSRRGGALAKQLGLFNAGLGGRLGRGSQWISWISLVDEVAALLWLIDRREVSGPVNLTAPEPITNASFTRALGSALRRPTALAVPATALKVALGAQLVDEALLASQRVMPSVLLDAGFDFRATGIQSGLRSALS